MRAFSQGSIMNDHTDLIGSTQFDVHLPCGFDTNRDFHSPVP